eukprot:4078637-Alexandrium_andersonii.AAC.1
MSASLVGSEMCIRDRPRVLPPDVQPRRRGLGGTRAPHEVPAAPAKSGAPVSYTHLTLPTICSV